MQFLSLSFFMFIPIVFAILYSVKKDYQYLVLLAANYIFYGWNNLNDVPVLLFSTVLTFAGGYILGKHRKRLHYILFFSLNILILIIYKYTDFVLGNINTAVGTQFSPVGLTAPIGLSFYIFQSSSYLNDVYRKGMPAETNFLRYAAFVSFFPCVLSGPIQRSRDLLPQLQKGTEFSFNKARTGLLLLTWGFFSKIVIADKLAAVTNEIFNNYKNYDNIFYIVAAVCFSLYIYCDFSSISDMACGTANLLGFDIKPNFKNPYLAENLADFWNRWHMSLNTWFLENVYIPLGGGRKGQARKYLNILIVFFISGLWHGASWSFIIWGVLNGVLRIAGEVTAPYKSAAYVRLKIDERCGSIRILKRIGVFVLITVTWVFFKVPSVSAALYIIKNMFVVYPTSFFNAEIVNVAGTAFATFKLILAATVFIFIQYIRKEEGKLNRMFTKQPYIVQNAVLAAAVCICIFSACSGIGTLNTEFVYFQF